MNEMKTVSEVINELKRKGYTEDFNLQENCINSDKGDHKFNPDEFVIDKVYRFEGESDPGDEATVYAISSLNHNIKGVLINGAGIYTDELTDEMLKKLEIKQQ